MEAFSISPNGKYVTITCPYPDKIVTIQKSITREFPKIIKTEYLNGDVFVKHLLKNGFEITKQKTPDGWKVVSIEHRDCIPYLYNKLPQKKSRIKAQGPVITEETIKLYEQLPSVLKKLCEPAINLLTENAKNAITTEKSKASSLSQISCEVDEKFKNRLCVEINEKGDIIQIRHPDVIPALYENVSKNPLRLKSNGIVLCDETIDLYAKLSRDLKEVCKPGIDYLIKQARKALMT